LRRILDENKIGLGGFKALKAKILQIGHAGKLWQISGGLPPDLLVPLGPDRTLP
jgi:hypothetical protein